MAGYWPIGFEIDVIAFLSHCNAIGIRCCLPYISEKTSLLVFKAWHPNDPLVRGKYNIPSPSGSAANIIPKVILVPLMAFDKKAHRLGRGGGFYDRTLEILRRKLSIVSIGVAFDEQEVDSVPTEPHDQKLDYIVTPTRIITG